MAGSRSMFRAARDAGAEAGVLRVFIILSFVNVMRADAVGLGASVAPVR